MFLRNSFVIFFLALHTLSFSLKEGLCKKEELIIPNLNMQECIKIENNFLKVKEDLNELRYQDQILVRKDNELYYYKVIGKHDKKLLSELLKYDASTLILYNEKESTTLHSVVVAINTGKMVKNS